MRRAKSIARMSRKERFIVFLEGTLIPDLMESGRTATAEDFKTCIAIMRGDDERIKKLTGRRK